MVPRPPRGGYSALPSSVRRRRAESGRSAREATIARARGADRVARMRALRELRARADYQALSANQRALAEDARVVQLNAERFASGISAEALEQSLPPDNGEGVEDDDNDEDDNDPAAASVALATAGPVAAPVVPPSTPSAPNARSAGDAVGRSLCPVVARWEGFARSAGLVELRSANDPTPEGSFAAWLEGVGAPLTQDAGEEQGPVEVLGEAIPSFLMADWEDDDDDDDKEEDDDEEEDSNDEYVEEEDDDEEDDDDEELERGEEAEESSEEEDEETAMEEEVEQAAKEMGVGEKRKR